jgi:hypothetical protein
MGKSSRKYGRETSGFQLTRKNNPYAELGIRDIGPGSE